MAFCCVLCPDKNVALDDIAVLARSGNVICLRCWQRETDTLAVLPHSLRAGIRTVLRQLARGIHGQQAHYCIGCGTSVFDSVLATHINGLGWVCDECMESESGHAYIAAIAAAEGISDPLYRCILCDDSCPDASYSLKKWGLGICPECQRTVLGRRLNQDDAFRIRFVRERGLIGRDDQPPPTPPPTLGEYTD